jgi:transposase
MQKTRKPKDNLATLYFFKIQDLEKKLGEKKRELNSEKRKHKSLQTELEKALEELEKLREEKVKLEEENEKLKECRKTYAKMIFKEKTQKTDSPKRGRKKGFQGISRKKPNEENINQEVDVTLSHCPDCGEVFNGCKRRYERVIEDIIIQPQIKITRYWIHQYECNYCGNASSATSNKIIGQSPFGKNIFATVLFYKYRLKTPLAKIKEALLEIHGIKISVSSIQNLLYQASVQFGEKYEELKKLLRDGKIAYADETGWRVNGEKWWTWLWSNDEISLFTTENTRGKGVPEKMLEIFKGLLVRDGYNAYNKVNTEQQICWVHLLRKAHEYCEREKSTQEMVLLKDTLKFLYRRMCRWHKKQHNSEQRIEQNIYQKKILIDLWKNRKWKEKDSTIFIREWLIRHQNRLTTFLKYSDAKPENNHAERAVRPMVILRKITGGSKSERGIKATDINMSIIETWAKQGLSIMQDIPIFGLSL